MIVGVLTTATSFSISFYGVMSRIRFMFLLFAPSTPELKLRIRTAIETITANMLQTLFQSSQLIAQCFYFKNSYVLNNR